MDFQVLYCVQKQNKMKQTKPHKTCWLGGVSGVVLLQLRAMKHNHKTQQNPLEVY